MVRLRRSLQPLLLSGAAILLSLGAPPVKSQVPAPRDAGRPVTAPATCAEPVARLISYQGTLNIRRTGVTPAAATLDDSFCPGDVLEVGPWSRAALQLADQTVVRVDADTVLSFTAPRDDKRTWLDILRGIIHVISRDPRDLRITTPYADAGIEGTEFLVQVADGATTVVVFEGLVLVSNGQGSVSAGSGESAVARQGSAPVLRQAVRSRDSVVWTLYYPPVTSGGRPAPDAAPLADAGVAFYLGRAEARLARGRAGEAAADLDAALAMAPGSGEVLARQSVMALTRGEADTAARLADDAVAAAPASASAWLAQSYLQQSRGELPAALASLETAAASEPGNALVQARLAELRLSLGDVDGAESAARSAAAADPGLSLAPVVLGFVEMARVNLAAAEAAFRQAIALESHAPLAHLGLGLTRIRAGDLAEGRESLEHAVILDPGDALVRSYVGKAYYEERRDELAGSQFAQAKALDPQDPTPWFYDAIRRQAGNDPVGALEDIQASIDRNDNRMAYRSRLTLDRDEAARSAGLGRIFSDLGFDQLALREGWKSVAADPRDHAGHRLLADSYVSLPRHEMARVSELLQSQLLQPVNATVVQPQLGEANLFILDSTGPSSIGFNEFNPLFVENGLQVQASGVSGSNDTWGADAVLAGIAGRWSFNLGGFHYETDGFRSNNDLESTIGAGLVQYQLSPATSILAELRGSRREQGELRLRFNPEEFDNSLPRQEEDSTTFRLGLRHDFTPRSTLVSLLVFESGDYLDTLVAPAYRADTEVDAYTGELQHIYRGDGWSTVAGIRYYRSDSESIATVFGQTLVSDLEPDAHSAYLYGTADILPRLQLTLGISRDKVDGYSNERERWNPKAGLAWRPVEGTLIRAGAFSTLQRPTPSRQDIQPSLEPTTVAGFNQFFFGSEAEDADRFGIGIDQRFSPSLYAGSEFSWRRMDVPYLDFTGFPPQDAIGKVDEQSGRAYLYWTPGSEWAASLSYEYDLLENEIPFTPNLVATVETHRFPVAFQYFGPRGFIAGLEASYIHQRGRFQDVSAPPFPFASDRDEFWVLDAGVGYRLPGRRGLLRLECRNCTDRSFSFQDVDPENPRVFPERILLLRLTLSD